MIKNGKIISNGDQTFNVPNTEEGKAFIKALRKFSNPKMKNGFACRGRGSRVEYAKKVGKFTAQASVSHEPFFFRIITVSATDALDFVSSSPNFFINLRAVLNTPTVCF